MAKKRQKKTPHPCIYLGDRDILCSHPDMVMRCEKYSNEDPKTYDTIPDECLECLLANLLVHIVDLKATSVKPTAFMKCEER